MVLYAGFSDRFNQLSEAFRNFATSLFEEFLPSDCFSNQSLLHSMPIISCSGKSCGKVAKELTDKGYCSTKSLNNYGVKLHALAFKSVDKMPFSKEIQQQYQELKSL